VLLLRASGDEFRSVFVAQVDARRGDEMSTDYVFLCGVMWAQYASEDARLELVRAQRCADPDLAFLASAILGRDSTPRLA